MAIKLERLTAAQVRLLDDEQLKHLQSVTSRLANETQRQAAHYQREADKLRRELNDRKRRNGA